MKKKTTDENEALELSENLFRSFVAASSELIYRMSADWQQMYTLSGRGFLQDTVHLSTNWVEMYIPEADQPQVWAAIREAITNKKNFELEHRVVQVNGNIGWTFSRAVPILDKNGQIKEWIGTANDITGRKGREQHQEFSLKVSDVLRALADPVAIQQTAMQLLGEQLGVNRAFYGDMQLDEDTLLIGPGYTDGLFPIEGQVIFSEFDSDLVKYYREGQTVIINDLYQDVELSVQARAAFDSIQVRAAVGVPLVKQGKVQAILSLHQSVPRYWQPEEIELLQDIAERTWAAVERARAEAELRKSEEKYRSLFEHMAEGYTLCQVIRDAKGQIIDFRYLEINSVFEQQTGAGRQTFIGRKFSEIYSKEEATRWIGTYKEVIDNDKQATFEDYSEQLDRWFTISVYSLNGEEMSVVFRDITERKHREQLREFLLKLSDALRTLVNSAEMEQTAMKMLGEELRVNRAFLASIHADGEHFSIRYDYADGLASSTGSYAMSEFQKKRLPQWRMGEITSTDDSEADSWFSAADRAAYSALGARAAISIPLVKAGRFAGLLAVNQAAPRKWKSFEKELLSESAEQIWAAIERARAEEALKESDKRFQSIANLVPDLLWESDPDGSTNWYNQRWLEYTGQRFEQATGWGWTKSIHPDDREASAERYTETVDAGRPLQQEHRIRRSDGEYRWFMVSTSPVIGENGRVVKMYGAATDIHERRHAEDALRESELQYRARLESQVKDRTAELHQNRTLLRSTLDSNSDMIQVFKAVRDEQGHIVDFVWVLNNHTSETVYGDVIGKSLLENNPGVITAGIFDAFVSVTENGIPQQYEKHYVHEQFDGWFYQSVVKMDDGVTTTTVNITARKHTEDERFKNYLLLQQSEDIALLGSWELTC